MTAGPFHDREAEELPVHVAACAERYRTLFNRLGRIETILLVITAKVFGILIAVIWFLINRAGAS